MKRLSPLLIPTIGLITGTIFGGLTISMWFLILPLLGALFIRRSSFWKSIVLSSLIFLFFFQFSIHSEKHEIERKPLSEGKTIGRIHISNVLRSDTVLWKAIGLGEVLSNHGWETHGISLLSFRPDQKLRSVNEGDTLMLEGKIRRLSAQKNPDQFDELSYYSKWDVYHEMTVQKLVQHRFAEAEKDTRSEYREQLASLLEDIPTKRVRGLLQAILTGDKALISREEKRWFAASGVMHLLAVSGLHVGLIAALPLFLLKQSSRRIPKLSFLLFSLLLVWTYTFLTGAAASTMRAAIMLSIAAIGIYAGRRNEGIHVLLTSGLTLLILFPKIIFDIGFQLSFAAVGGILLWSPILNRHLNVRVLRWNKLRSAIAVSISAQGFTTPFSLYYFGLFPVYFLPANLILIPIATLLLYVVIVHLILKSMDLSFHWLIQLMDLLGNWIFSCTQFVAELPWASFDVGSPSVLESTLVAFLMLTLLVNRGKKVKAIRWVVLASVGFIAILRLDHRDELIVFSGKHLEMIGYRCNEHAACIQLRKYASTRSSYGWRKKNEAIQIDLSKDTLIAFENSFYWRKKDLICLNGMLLELEGSEELPKKLSYNGRLLATNSTQEEAQIFRINSNGNVGTQHGLHRPPIP